MNQRRKARTAFVRHGTNLDRSRLECDPIATDSHDRSFSVSYRFEFREGTAQVFWSIFGAICNSGVPRRPLGDAEYQLSGTKKKEIVLRIQDFLYVVPSL